MDYRTVTLRLEPTPKQAQVIDYNMKKVSKFLEISKREFQKIIWQRARRDLELSEAHTRLLDLLSQRFTGSVMGNLLYPLDERNCSIVKVKGWYGLEVRFKPRKKTFIPIARPDRKYYEEIQEGKAYPAFIYKQGGSYFLSVSIPVEKRFEEARPTAQIGIDLNQRKHAASLYNPETKKFEWNDFFDLKPIDEKVKKLEREISTIQRGKKTSKLSAEEKEKIKGLHERIKKVIEKGHGDFISKLVAVANEYWEKGYNVVFVLEDLKGITKRAEKEYLGFNRWLHSQWCYRKFGVLLKTRDYPVEEVDPRDTSTRCYRCGATLEIYGKRDRLVRCEECGLEDFSRDLNAARNLAKRFCEELLSRSLGNYNSNTA